MGPRGFLRWPRPGHVNVFPKQTETQRWGLAHLQDGRASPLQHLEPGPVLPGSSPPDPAGQPRTLNNGKSDRHTFYHIRAPSMDRCPPVLSSRPPSRGLARGQPGGRPAATASSTKAPELMANSVPPACRASVAVCLPHARHSPRTGGKSVELCPDPSSFLSLDAGMVQGAVGTGSR